MPRVDVVEVATEVLESAVLQVTGTASTLNTLLAASSHASVSSIPDATRWCTVYNSSSNDIYYYTGTATSDKLTLPAGASRQFRCTKALLDVLTFLRSDAANQSLDVVFEG